MLAGRVHELRERVVGARPVLGPLLPELATDDKVRDPRNEIREGAESAAREPHRLRRQGHAPVDVPCVATTSTLSPARDPM